MPISYKATQLSRNRIYHLISMMPLHTSMKQNAIICINIALVLALYHNISPVAVIQSPDIYFSQMSIHHWPSIMAYYRLPQIKAII